MSRDYDDDRIMRQIDGDVARHDREQQDARWGDASCPTDADVSRWESIIASCQTPRRADA